MNATLERQQRLEAAIDAIWSDGTPDEQAEILHLALTSIPNQRMRAEVLAALEAALAHGRRG